MTSNTQFLLPKVLAQIKDLPLVAKTVAQGFMQGMHQSVQRGSGMEFSQYRSYEPGDPLSRVDWKLFARNDRYYVREAERESNLDIWFVLDSSASMLHGAALDNISAQNNRATPSNNAAMDKSAATSDKHASSQWHKLDYAKHLIASLAYIAQQQGDSYGFLSLSSAAQSYLPAQSGHSHYHQLLLQLSQVQSGPYFPAPAQLQAQLGKLRKQGLIIIVSDFYQRNQEISAFAQSLMNKHTDVLALQLTSTNEHVFNYTGKLQFEDRETGKRVALDAKQAREQYMQAFAAFQSDLQHTCTLAQIDLHTLNIDHAMDSALRHVMMARQRAL